MICICSVDSVRFGIQTLAPKFFGSPPDFVVSGPNIGSEWLSYGCHSRVLTADPDNLGTVTRNSGTV